MLCLYLGLFGVCGGKHAERGTQDRCIIHGEEIVNLHKMLIRHKSRHLEMHNSHIHLVRTRSLDSSDTTFLETEMGRLSTHLDNT